MQGLKITDLSREDRVIIKAGLLINSSMQAVKDVHLDIQRGIIKDINAVPSMYNLGGAGCAAAGQGSIKLLDFSHLTILPGMIDCHVHLALDGEDFGSATAAWNNPLQFFTRAAEDLKNTLCRGIVAVRDGGDSAGMGLKCREKILSGELAGPLVMSSATALRRQDKYGSFLGPPLNAAAIKDTVLQLAAQGACQVKVLTSGVVSFKEYGRVGEIQFSAAELREIVAAARDSGLKVMAHASLDPAVELCLQAGVDSVEHGYFISRGSLEAMAEKGIAWVPTVIPVAVQARPPHDKNHSPESLEVIKRTYRQQLKMIKTASQIGVTLGVGTDAGATGVRHGESYLEELFLFKSAGLTNGQIIKAATQNGAEILGLKDSHGAIESSRPACLIAVEGNPLQDLGALSKIKHIVHPGHAEE